MFSFAVDPLVSCLNAIPFPKCCYWVAQLMSLSAAFFLRCQITNSEPAEVLAQVAMPGQSKGPSSPWPSASSWDLGKVRTKHFKMDGALRSTASPVTPDHGQPSAHLPPVSAQPGLTPDDQLSPGPSTFSVQVPAFYETPELQLLLWPLSLSNSQDHGFPVSNAVPGMNKCTSSLLAYSSIS